MISGKRIKEPMDRPIKFARSLLLLIFKEKMGLPERGHAPIHGVKGKFSAFNKKRAELQEMYNLF